jgi:hypothetical protein
MTGAFAGRFKFNANISGGAVQVEFSWTHSLKLPGYNPRPYKMKTWYQSLLSNAFNYFQMLSTCTATRRVEHLDGHADEVDVRLRVCFRPAAAGLGHLEVAMYKLNPVDR